MKRVIIVSGGQAPSSELFRQLNVNGALLIGADRGAEFFKEEGIIPDFLVGDFDSLDSTVLEYFRKRTKIETYDEVKDFTDTEAAFFKAMSMNPKEIYLLGCTGSRLDHVFGNLSLLKKGEEAGISSYLMDDHNKISLFLSSGEITQSFGEYISFQSFGACVEDFTIEGAMYPLKGYTLKAGDPRTVSNEFREKTIKISFKTGIVMVFQTKD